MLTGARAFETSADALLARRRATAGLAVIAIVLYLGVIPAEFVLRF
jgi:hypothetical protein